jgi:hypothetical protein
MAASVELEPVPSVEPEPVPSVEPVLSPTVRNSYSHISTAQIDGPELSQLPAALEDLKKGYELYTRSSPISDTTGDAAMYEFYACYLNTWEDGEVGFTENSNAILGIIALVRSGEKYYDVHGPAIASKVNLNNLTT